jgi:hypothetical protein
MKKLLILIITSNLFADTCIEYQNKLGDILGYVDDHVKHDRLISACNELDRAEFFNHMLIVKCNSKVAEDHTKRHIYYMKKFYCKGIK